MKAKWQAGQYGFYYLSFGRFRISAYYSEGLYRWSALEHRSTNTFSCMEAAQDAAVTWVKASLTKALEDLE